MDQAKLSAVPSSHNSRDQKIHALTSARFFAALFVVFFHTQWGIDPQSMLGRIIKLGYVSPYFFFLLSGYILAVVYLRKQPTVPVRRFFISRFARIYPLFYLATLMDFPFTVADRMVKYGLAGSILRNLGLLGMNTFLLQMWLPTLTVINIASWTLSIEAAFYLSFPFLGPLFWKLSGRMALVVSFLLYLGAVLVEIAIIHRFGDAGTAVSGFHLISFEAIFVCGVLLARWQVSSDAQAHSQVTSAPVAWIVAFLSIVAFAICVWIYPWLNAHKVNTAYVLTPVYMTVIWVLATSRISLVRVLCHPWLVILGEASYGLYLIHTPVRHLFGVLHIAGNPINYPLYLTTCIGLSVLSFFYFETPCRKFILRKLHSGTKETQEAASAAQ